MTSIQPAYIEKMIDGIKDNTGEAAILFELKNDLLCSSDTVMLVGKIDGNNVKISLTESLSIINNLIDKMLDSNCHQLIIDFEDHMDTASASDKKETVSDFRNRFIDSFL